MSLFEVYLFPITWILILSKKEKVKDMCTTLPNVDWSKRLVNLVLFIIAAQFIMQQPGLFSFFYTYFDLFLNFC